MHHLAVELKKEKTTIYVTCGPHKGEFTADPHIWEQTLMLQELNRLGYFARFGVGCDKSIHIIEWYLNLNHREAENGELFQVATKCIPQTASEMILYLITGLL